MPDNINIYVNADQDVTLVEQVAESITVQTVNPPDVQIAPINPTNVVVTVSGPPGPAGSSAVASEWLYDSSEVMSAPLAGRVRTNAATSSAVTQVAINVLDSNGLDTTVALAALSDGDVVFAQEKDNASNWAKFEVSAAPTNNTTWFQIPVTYLSSGGAPATKNEQIYVRFTYSGAGGGVTDHGALTGLADDDHPQYQKTAQKGAASGYASLDAGTKVPIAEIPTGTTGTTVSLGDHAHSGVYDPAGTATGAISTHEGASDPHPQYLTSTEGNAAYEATGAAASAISSHESALDPHTGYQKESEKGAASGYASLDASTKVPYAQLPTGTAASTVAIGDHGHDYAPTTHSHVEGDLPSTLATDTEVATAVSNHNSGSPHVALASTTPADLGTAAVGVGTTSARADHVHDMPTAVDVGAEASGAVATHAATAGHELMSDTNAVALGTAGPGVGTTVSRTDHVHPMPSAANVGAEPAGTVATHAGTAGHEPLASTNPANLGTAAVGTGTTAARDDHVHAMPTAANVGAPPTARTITSGAGLTGGGDLSADRTLAVGAGTGITVNADDVAVNRTTVDAWYEPAGAVSAHAGAADPHPTYLKPAEVLAGTNMTVDLITTPGSVILNASTPSQPAIANFVVGSSVAITTGVKKAYWNVQKTGTITAWKIIADTSTTASISVLKSTTMPTFSALGTASITAAQTATGTPSWAVTAGDIMDIEILNNNNATKIVLEITIT